MLRFACLMLLFIIAVSRAQSTPDLALLAARAPDVMLDPIYHSFQHSPCQYYGFTFDDNYEEMKQMRELGAVSVMTNRIWIPVQDESAPNGDGYHIGPAHSKSDDTAKFTLFDTLDNLKMSCAIAVGDWNNGLFPYYPDWFYVKYPNFGMVDQHGSAFEATMFDKPRRWPSIEHPEQIEGCARFIEEFCDTHQRERSIPMWVMGGEELYPTYLWPDRWADYSELAVTHFREWCKYTYGNVDAANEAWKTSYGDFTEVSPPIEPDPSDRLSEDWFRFRLRAMAERFVWMYQAVRYGDTSRLILSCNHGDIYHGYAATQMGMMPDVYAGVCDGFETGQIITGDDPDYLNLMYAESFGSLGKPVAPTRLAYKFLDPKARGGSRSYTPDAVWRYSYETLGAGGWLLGILQWRGSLPDGEWGVKETPAVKDCAVIFDMLKQHADDFIHMYPVKPKLAVYLPRDEWLLKSWHNSWTELHKLLIQQQIPKAYIYDDSDFSGYDNILIVDSQVHSPQVLEKLRQCLNSGTTVTCLSTKPETRCEHSNLLALLRRKFPLTLSPGSDCEVTTYSQRGGDLLLAKVAPNRLKGFVDAYFGKKAPLYLKSSTAVNCTQTISLNSKPQDNPIDLHCTGYLRQEIMVPEGILNAVSFCTPTFLKKVERIRLQANVKKEDGTVVGSVSIPADELTDNSWHDIPISGKTQPGDKLVVEFTEPEGLPIQTLGVWATRADSNPGRLSDSQNELNGDIICHARTATTIPQQELIEAFTLSDSLNLMNVLVNLSEQDADIEVRLNDIYVTDSKAQYTILDITSNISIGTLTRKEPVYKLTIPAKRAVAVLIQRQTTEQEAKEAVEALGGEPVYGHYARTYYYSAHNALEKKQYSKALAMAVRAGSALGMDAHVTISDRVLHIDATVTRSMSEKAVVSAKITPAFGYSCILQQTEPRRYRADIPLSDLPKMYDYKSKQYVDLTGPFAVDITVRDGDRIGAVRAAVGWKPRGCGLPAK